VPRGGYRPGSGRPPGARNILTREVDDRIAKGLTPLEALVDVMRFYHVKATALWAELDAGEAAQPQASRNGRERRRRARILREAIRMSDLATGAAAKAAPYFHQRMGYASDDDAEDEFVPLAERVAYYDSPDHVDAAPSEADSNVPLQPDDLEES
jgi:hypothetical protein